MGDIKGEKTVKCRLCLDPINHKDAGDLFGQDDLAKKLLQLFQLQLEFSSYFPSLVCGKCVKMVQEVEKFRETIISSHCKLFREVARVKKNSNFTDFVTERHDNSVEMPVEVKPVSQPPKKAKPKQDFQCEICGVTLHSRGGFYAHKLLHLPKDQRPHKCTYCPKTFVDSSAKQRHIQRMHEVHVRVKCKICGKGLSSKGTMWDHIKAHEKGVRMQKTIVIPDGPEAAFYIKCAICKAPYKRIRAHMKQVHKQDYIPTEEHLEKVPCSICGREFPRYQLYAHHHVTHMKTLPPCHICGESFKNFKSRKIHMDRHLDKKYPCEYCPKTCVTSQGLYLHIRSHHPEMRKKRRWVKDVIAERKEKEQAVGSE